jgi:hypothetical protein
MKLPLLLKLDQMLQPITKLCVILYLILAKIRKLQIEMWKQPLQGETVAVAPERGQRQRPAPALSSVAGTAGTASGVVRHIGVFRSSCRGPGACRQRGCSRHPSYGPPCASPAAAKTARTAPTIPRLKRTSEPWSSLQEHGPARSGEKMGRRNL